MLYSFQIIIIISDYMSEEKKEFEIKKLANLLKKGYTMTSEACPACKSPLFLDKNKELFCGACNKKVIKAKDEHQLEDISIESVMLLLKKILNQKIEHIGILLNKETDLKNMNEITTILNNLLESLSRINKLIKEF